MARILLSPIGRSPGAVTGIYHALAEQEPPVAIDAVVLISTTMPRVLDAAKIVRQTIGRDKVHIFPLRGGEQPSHDFTDEATILDFVHQVNAVLDHARRGGNDVYIGISGGRSSMGALATLSAYVYGAAGVFHLWVDEEIERHGDIDRLPALPAQREPILKPPPDRRKLVAVPLAPFDRLWDQERLEAILDEYPEAHRALQRAVTDADLEQLKQLQSLQERQVMSYEEIAQRLRELFRGTEIANAVEAAIKFCRLSTSEIDPAEVLKVAETLKRYYPPSLWQQIRQDLSQWGTWKAGFDRLVKFVEAIAAPLAVGGFAALWGIPLK
jgi:hypothetical protein